MERSDTFTGWKIVEQRSLTQKALFGAVRVNFSPSVDGNAYLLAYLNHQYWQIEVHRDRYYGC